MLACAGIHREHNPGALTGKSLANASVSEQVFAPLLPAQLLYLKG